MKISRNSIQTLDNLLFNQHVFDSKASYNYNFTKILSRNMKIIKDLTFIFAQQISELKQEHNIGPLEDSGASMEYTIAYYKWLNEEIDVSLEILSESDLPENLTLEQFNAISYMLI